MHAVIAGTVPGLPNPLSFSKRKLGSCAHTSTLAVAEHPCLSECLGCTAPAGVATWCSFHYTVVIIKPFSQHYTIQFAIMLTQRSRALDAQQFRTVLIKCGGSEKKKRLLPSLAHWLGTLYTKSVFRSWSLINLLLTGAPSKVAPIT